MEVPLSSLELEHGHVNSLSLVIQRPGKPSKRRKPSPGDDSDEELPAGNGNIGRRSGQQPQTHTVEATVPQNMGEIAPAPPSGEIDAAPDAHQAQRSNRVQRTSAPKDMVHKLADIGRKKECTLDVDLQFVPFTSHEAKMASDVATGLQPRMSMVPDRLRRLLRGGMLYVNLTRAEGLPSNKGRLTRKFRIKVGRNMHRKQSTCTYIMGLLPKLDT